MAPRSISHAGAASCARFLKLRMKDGAAGLKTVDTDAAVTDNRAPDTKPNKEECR